MTLVLSTQDLRAVTAFAAGCAQAVLEVFEAGQPDDRRPRAAIDAAWAFARGGERGKALRDAAWAALRAAGDADAAAREAAGDADGAAALKTAADADGAAAREAALKTVADGAAAREAALAAMAAAGAAYLHPLAQATQVKHILGAGAHAARATELIAGDDRTVGAAHVATAARQATPTVVDVLNRFPAAPSGGGRVGELIRMLDAALRH